MRTKQLPQRMMNRSLLSQSVLQCLTFTAAILTYHYVAMPRLAFDAYQNGQAAGWSNAVEQTCPLVKDKIGG